MRMKIGLMTSSLLIFAALVSLVRTYSVQDETRLQEDLLTGYNSNVRPADQILISCSLDLRNILHLDTVEQTLAITGALLVIWSDHRLTWNASDNGNVTSVYLRLDQIWRPTLVLQNSAVGIEVLGDNGNQKSIPLIVSSDGRVFWLAPAYFISYCSVDVSKYPFDTQTCELKISGWLYTAESATLSRLTDYINFDAFEENGEYDIIRNYTRVDRSPLLRTYIETLVFVIELRRKYSYYLVNVVLPVFFMQLLGLVVFIVPTESGEKLTFSLTLLLSLTVMMTLVAEKIPTTSLQIPLLSIYMLGGTVISSLEVIMTVVILYFKHHQKDNIQIGKGVRFLKDVIGLMRCKKKKNVKNKINASVCEAEEQRNAVMIVESVDAGSKLEDEKTDIPASDRDEVDKVIYTPDEMSATIEKFSFVIFTLITFLFTFAILIMII